MKTLLLNKDQSITLDYTSNTLSINGKNIDSDPNDPTHALTTAEKENLAHVTKRSFYQKKLERQFENFVVLSGAGTSVGIGAHGNVGKTMGELWNLVDADTTIGLSAFCASLGFPYSTEKDLEKLLSVAKRAVEFQSKFPTINIADTVNKIEKIIKDACSLALPDNSPHEIFLNKIVNRKLKYPRAKLFTLNYDTLFEQAANRAGFILIDGFSYTYPREFNGHHFNTDFVIREKSRIKDEENFLPRVLHLYKIHGSVNWTMKNDKIVQEENTVNPLMIFPRDTKYEQSYEQPFFEMLARFQFELRRENVLLLCIGFSFGDRHLVTAIREAIAQNPSLEIIIVSRTIRNDSEWRWFLDKAKLDSRITLIAEEFTDFSTYYPENRTVTKEEVLSTIYNK